MARLEAFNHSHPGPPTPSPLTQVPVLNYWAAVTSVNQCATSLSILCVVLEVRPT